MLLHQLLLTSLSLSHLGHTCHELFVLRSGKIDLRLVDAVVWPGIYVYSRLFIILLGCHDHVEKIVQLATTHNVCLIPFGG